MELVLSEDQELIAKTARDFFGDKAPLSRTRELRDAADAAGFSEPLWAEMAELGWVGIPFPESVGGGGLGYAEMVLVMEAAGRSLVPEPFLATILAGETIAQGGDDAQKAQWLTPLVAGKAILALAFEEKGSRFRRDHCATLAESAGSGWRLSGEKIAVLDGHVADAFVVLARTAGEVDDAEGMGLFLVPADAKGVARERQSRVDSRGAAMVFLDGVEVGPEALIGSATAGGALLDAVLDRATIALCGEMLGSMEQAMEMTLTYMKEREQFGVRIGSFQALKHRTARLFIDIELSRSSVMAASRALDEGDSEARALVSLAKAQCSEAAMNVANESVQIYGGVGMTDEYDIGFFLKRARAAELTFGDASFHRARWAQLAGY